MLMLSFFSSAFFVPLTTALEGDMTAMQDEILGFMSTNGYVETETISLPATSFVTFEEQTLSVPMTSTEDIFTNARVNGQINSLSGILTGMLPDFSSYDAMAAPALPFLCVSSISEIVDNMINAIDA